MLLDKTQGEVSGGGGGGGDADEEKPRPRVLQILRKMKTPDKANSK